ncbi:MAG: ABC transporter permease [Motilibacteraceae bacterium]
MTLAPSSEAASAPVPAPTHPSARGDRAPSVAAHRLRALTATAGVLPFLAYVGVFLLAPTAVVAVGALSLDGRPSLENLRALGDDLVVQAFVRSITLSALTAVVGAVLGALVAYAVSTAGPHSLLRRVVVSVCGVLAQFGGVMLAFAFVATIGLQGLVTVLLRDAGIDIYAGGVWLFELPGLALVYTYFQVPLMVVVFLPALDGLRPQWREATANLGGSALQFWRHVGAPVLLPSFLGCTLLLFANAFSAYATAAALVSQGAPLVPLQIRAALTSEVLLGRADVGKALALGMVVVVVLVMAAYTVLQRRTARWLR